MKVSDKFLERLGLAAELYGKRISPQAVAMFAEALKGYEESDLVHALSKCMTELKFFPTVSDIIDRINFGHPGPDEAWAMVPKSEAESVCWTVEMRKAYGVVREMVEDDPIAARIAFREAYKRETQESKGVRRKATWELSLGHSKAHRESVIQEALREGRLNLEYAQAVFPELTAPNEFKNQLGVDNPIKKIVNQMGRIE